MNNYKFVMSQSLTYSWNKNRSSYKKDISTFENQLIEPFSLQVALEYRFINITGL